MTGIFGILESSATQWYQDGAPTQQFFFFIITSVSLLESKRVLKLSRNLQTPENNHLHIYRLWLQWGSRTVSGPKTEKNVASKWSPGSVIDFKAENAVIRILNEGVKVCQLTQEVADNLLD